MERADSYSQGGFLRAESSNSQFIFYDKEFLDEQGYVFLPNHPNHEKMEILRQGFEEQYELERREGNGQGKREGGTRHVARLADKNVEFESLYSNPFILWPVYHILQRDFRLWGFHGRDPLPGFGQQGLHADRPPRRPGSPYEAVTAIWMLDDFTIENGATRLVPGSHKWERPPDKAAGDPNRNYPGQIQVEGKAGSLLIFNAHLWHSGMRNNSQKPRRAIICNFSATDVFGSNSLGEIDSAKLTIPMARYLTGQ